MLFWKVTIYIKIYKLAMVISSPNLPGFQLQLSINRCSVLFIQNLGRYEWYV